MGAAIPAGETRKPSQALWSRAGSLQVTRGAGGTLRLVYTAEEHRIALVQYRMARPATHSLFKDMTDAF